MILERIDSGETFKPGTPLSVTERIRELRSAAGNVPLPEGYAEREDLLAQADALQWELDQYRAIRARVLALAGAHKAEKERELFELRRKRESDDPLTFADFSKLQHVNIDRAIPDPARLLEESRHVDLQQRIDEWCARLQAAGLLTLAEVRAANTQIPPSPAVLAQQREEAKAFEKLSGAREYILGQIIRPGDRRDALNAYNNLDEPLSEDKLKRWLQSLVNAKLLGAEWLPGRWRLGGNKLQSLLKE